MFSATNLKSVLEIDYSKNLLLLGNNDREQ